MLLVHKLECVSPDEYLFPVRAYKKCSNSYHLENYTRTLGNCITYPSRSLNIDYLQVLKCLSHDALTLGLSHIICVPRKIYTQHSPQRSFLSLIQNAPLQITNICENLLSHLSNYLRFSVSIICKKQYKLSSVLAVQVVRQNLV